MNASAPTEMFLNTTLTQTIELTSIKPYYVYFTKTDVIVSAVLLITFMVFGIIANVTTIAVIITTKQLRSIFNYFILSLCVSDTISALISWINLYRRTWGFDYFVLTTYTCYFYWALDIWTSYVTSLHIVSFAILRFIGIARPNMMKKITSTRSKLWIFILWVVGFFGGGLPMGLFSGVAPKNRTSTEAHEKWPVCAQVPKWLDAYRNYTIIGYTIFFYIPIVCTLIISVMIAGYMTNKRRAITGHLSNSVMQGRRTKEKQAILQLALIIASFLIGYLPFTAFEFHTYTHVLAPDGDLTRDWRFGTYQYICMRFSECLNPIFYNLGSAKMRKSTKLFFYRIFHKRHSNRRGSHVATLSGSITVPAKSRSNAITQRVTMQCS